MTAIVRPVRLQLSRKRGFNLHELSMETNELPAVNVARPSKRGNPFEITHSDQGWLVSDERFNIVGQAPNKLGARHIAVNKFRDRLETRAIEQGVDVRIFARALRGHNLACWCPLDGGPCHANVWLEFACEGV